MTFVAVLLLHGCCLRGLPARPDDKAGACDGRYSRPHERNDDRMVTAIIATTTTTAAPVTTASSQSVRVIATPLFTPGLWRDRARGYERTVSTGHVARRTTWFVVDPKSIKSSGFRP